MFGLLGIAFLAETIAAIAQTRGADPIAAGAMTTIFAVMTYLFGTTRVKDQKTTEEVGRTSVGPFSSAAF